MQPHILVLHFDSVPQEFFQDFTASISAPKLELAVQPSPSGAPFAAIEWLMPTAIAAYLAKPYFESFLKEMGKDHYGVVKNSLKKLYLRVAGANAPEVSQIGTQGKVAKEQPYSLFFSIVVEGPGRDSYKLLIPRPVTEIEYEAAISGFLDFAERLHARQLDERTIALLSQTPQVGRTVLVVYDVESQRIKPVDPLAGRRHLA